MFKRDPSLYIAAIAAILGVFVSLGFKSLTAEQAGLIMGAITAAGGVWTAIHTRPIPPSIFTSFLGAGALVLVSYGFNLSPDVLAAVQVAVSSLVGILTWQSVSPTGSPAAVRSATRAA
jgi:hypothetical protein